LHAQQSNTFYLMHAVPQSNLLNPAVQIQCKYFIGIPVLSSIHLNYSNTAFTYNTLAGTDSWNIEKTSKQINM
jgi:ethanolamine ammonia-lyase large subunit